MSARGSIRTHVGCAAICLLVEGVASAAGPLYVDTTMTPRTVVGNGQATGTVLAYTNDNGKVNNTTSLFNNQVDPVYSGPADVYNTMSIPATVPGIAANKVPKFSPPVGLANFAKNINSINNTAQSANSAPFLQATLQSLSNIVWTAGKNPRIQVQANTVVANNAYAAARGVDPVPVAYGTQLELNPTIDISLGIRPGDSFAGTEMGEQLASISQPLWSLSVYAIGPISSTDSSNLIVNFTSLSSLGLNDTAIANSIQQSFTVGDDGTAVMANPITPFDVFYTVNSLGGDTYSDFNQGNIAVPEPSTLMLAVLGGIALLAIRRRR